MASFLTIIFGIGFHVQGGGELRTDIVKRSPLWTYPNKSVPAEKAQRKKAAQLKNQRKLLEVQL
jgi:hypothetical protein